MSATFARVEPRYRRPDGLYSIDLASIKPPAGFTIRDAGLFLIPAGVIGGNHRHPRQECFIGLGEGLAVIWQDEHGQTHEEPMNPDGEVRLFHMPSMLPHAVINRGSGPATLYELADGPQVDVERIKLV
jgi:uncharacterized RmlC-like cupin family protein